MGYEIQYGLAAQEFNRSIVVIKSMDCNIEEANGKGNKRIYRKIQSFDCEPAPRDIPEYYPNFCPLR